MWIVAIARNASKQAAMRSQRTTKRRYFFWNQAKVRSAWNRGTPFLIGLPRFFHIPTKQKRRSPGQGTKKPLDHQRPEKNGSQITPVATSFRAPSECRSFRRTG